MLDETKIPTVLAIIKTIPSIVISVIINIGLDSKSVE